MPRELELEEKLRRSEVLTEEDIYKDFMMYAREVRDQFDIYVYMEENQIGTNVTEYWLARFKVMRRLCQLVKLVRLIDHVKILPEVYEWKITEYEHRLRSELFHVIAGSVRGKRKVSSFNMMKDRRVHPEKRMIGNIEVYVDSPERKTYELQDYAKFVENEMKDYCQIERADYRRSQAGKPYSFIAKKQQHLLRLAQELLSKNRRSLNGRNSLAPGRFSNRINLKSMENLNQDVYLTPKEHQAIAGKNSSVHITKLKDKMENDRSRDSVEILRQMMQIRADQFQSPKFRHEACQFQQQRMASSHQEQERCRGPVTNDKSFLFSFGKNDRYSSQRKVTEQPRFQEEREDLSIDNAFILYSFSRDVEALHKGQSVAGKREDYELQHLIRECQQQKYQRIETKTFSSEIDSNQENKDFQNQTLFTCQHRIRKPFEVLLQTDSNHVREMSSIDLEDLNEIQTDNNPEAFQLEQKQLFQQSQQKLKYIKTPLFYSQRKHPFRANERDGNSRHR